jgi:methionine-rich copper-binding protein CopC
MANQCRLILMLLLALLHSLAHASVTNQWVSRRSKADDKPKGSVTHFDEFGELPQLRASYK